MNPIIDKLIDLADQLDLNDNKVEASVIDGLIKSAVAALKAAEPEVCAVCGEEAIPGILVEDPSGKGYIRCCPVHLEEYSKRYLAELAEKMKS